MVTMDHLVRKLIAKQKKKENESTNVLQNNKAVLVYVLLMLLSTAGIYSLFQSVFPKGLTGEEGCERFWEALGLVSSSTQRDVSSRVALVWECAEKVRGPGALLIYACLWISLKALAIPGSMILCVALGGFLTPLQAQIFATICEVIGGSLCYFLSSLIGRPLLNKFAPVLLEKFQARVEAKRREGHLFYFALFVRMTPLIPNWFVNAASQPTGIPYPIFVTTMVLGIQIATFLSIRAGILLFALRDEIEKGDSLLNGQFIQNFVILLLAQFLALIPVYMSRKEEAVIDDKKE